MNHEIIRQFYQDYHARLIKFATALMRSQEDAEEAVHNVFQKLWNTDKLGQIKKPYPYLIQCTKYEAYALLSKDKKEKELSFQFVTVGREEKISSDEEESRIGKLRGAIDQLPPKCKEIMLLKVGDGLTHSEISDYLKVSEKTIENQVSIAIKKIRKYFKQN